MLTHATLDVLATDPGTRAIAKAMMTEGQAVGEALGAGFAGDIDKRIEGAAAVWAPTAPPCCIGGDGKGRLLPSPSRIPT